MTPPADDVIERAYLVCDGAGRESRTFELEVPRDLRFFDGHFAGQPLVAGVVQLDLMILPRVERLWPDLGPLRVLRRAKFRAPIGPGDVVSLRLERERGARRVVYEILQGGDVYSAGTLLFSGTGP